VNPLPVREQQERTPTARAQNTRFGITPAAVEGFDYYAAFSSAVGAFARWFSVWAFPWWTGTAAPPAGGAGFSNGFSSGFEGGVGSPTGAGFSTGFSPGFR
jgi:hypothetical protein